MNFQNTHRQKKVATIVVNTLRRYPYYPYPQIKKTKMEEFENRLKTIPENSNQEHEKNMTEIKEVQQVLYSFFKSLTDYGDGIRKLMTDYQLNYYNTLQERIILLSKPELVYQCLIEEKGKFSQNIILANIRRDGYDRKNSETIIEKILLPLIAICEEKMESYKKIPLTDKSDLQLTEIIKQEFNIEKKAEDLSNVENTNIKEKTDASEVAAPVLPDGFKQIECDATKEQIEYYFSILAKESNPRNGNPYMLQSEIDELLNKNFVVFNKVPTARYFNVNLTKRQKRILKYFIYQFYDKYEITPLGTKQKYVNFLIWNFDLFKDDNSDSLNGNMNPSKKPTKNSAIRISKYFQ